MIAKLIITRSKSLLEANFGFVRVVLAYLWERPRGGLPVTSALRFFAERNRRNWIEDMGAQRHFGSPVERQ